MKNFAIVILVFIVIILGVGGYYFVNNIKENARINEIKKGWYIEIINDSINVRTKPDRTSSSLG